uniref:MBD domain-containing protein n=1 Tax=Solanum tuberosum TaxID=4113 RepID=M1DV49_SOLTU
MIDHEKKKRSVFRNVRFRIEPSKGEVNCYTIYNPQAVSTNPAEEPICDRLNRKYKEMLHGWIDEKRQRENGSGGFDMYYYHKSKQYRSILEVRKYVFKGLSKFEVDQATTEVKEVLMIECLGKEPLLLRGFRVGETKEKSQIFWGKGWGVAPASAPQKGL